MNPLSDIFSTKLPQFRWSDWKKDTKPINSRNIKFFICHKDKEITFDRIVDKLNVFNTHPTKTFINEPKYNKWTYMDSDEITYNYYIQNNYKLV